MAAADLMVTGTSSGGIQNGEDGMRCNGGPRSSLRRRDSAEIVVQGSSAEADGFPAFATDSGPCGVRLIRLATFYGAVTGTVV